MLATDERKRVSDYVGKLMSTYSSHLPDLAFEIIPADAAFPPNRAFYSSDRTSDPGTLVRATWKSRNGKLATVTRSLILSTWDDIANRVRLDSRVDEHRRRSSYELTFDPMAIDLIRFHTRLEEEDVRKAIMNSRHDRSIEMLFDPVPDAKVRIEGMDVQSPRKRDLQEQGIYKAWMRLVVTKGRVNVLLQTTETVWETAKRRITLNMQLPETTLMALVGKSLDHLVGEDFAKAYRITRATSGKQGCPVNSCVVQYACATGSA